MEILEKTENQIFSFSRFRQLMKSDFRINQPKYLRSAATIIGCFLTMAILISIFEIREANTLKKLGEPIFYSVMRHAQYYYFASFFIATIGLTILGSLTFSSMSSKSGRISTLMMPASMLEKFLLRFLVYFIGGILLLIIGYLIGFLELYVTSPDKNALFYCTDTPMYTHKDIQIVKCMSIIIGMPILFSNAFYTLGSALWPKTSWVKTWVLQQALGVLFLITGAFGAFDLFVIFLNWLDNIDSADTVLWIYAGVFIVFIACCWGLAWWRFRTTQIVQRFMKK